MAEQSEKSSVQWVNFDTMDLCLLFDDGTQAQGPLKEGPQGFLTAMVAGRLRSTDIPNKLLAQQKTKEKNAAKVTKKPAAASRVAAASPVATAAASPVATSYGIMYYKRTHLIGIRQKFGEKRQIVSFGGSKRKVIGVDKLRAIGGSVCSKLAGGLSVAEAKAWAIAEMDAAMDVD